MISFEKVGAKGRSLRLTPGLTKIISTMSKSSFLWPPSVHLEAFFFISWNSAGSLSGLFRSVRITSVLNSDFRIKLNIEMPVFPSPAIRTFLLSRVYRVYLNFKVLSATTARIMDIIQNLTITFGSAQPLSSK